MPASGLSAPGQFDPETIKLLSNAFETAWHALERAGDRRALQRDRVRDLLARRIIEAAQLGERDGDILVRDALEHLQQVFPADRPDSDPRVPAAPDR